MVDRSGRVRWHDTIARLIEWEGEAALQMVVLDVTEQATFQATLRESEERFRLLADNVSDVITLYDQNQVYRYLSPSIERMAGYKPDEIVGRDVFFLTLEGGKFWPEARGRLVESPNTHPVVWQMRCKDGSIIWVESRSSLVPSVTEGGGFVVVSALRDVTERIEREEELRAKRDRLKSQAEELNVLAQNLDLERERAEAANAAKSQFLAMMSHELRTPMTGVLGMADLLSLSRLTDEQAELTRLLKRSARMLLDLLNDILDFSKIEADQLEFEALSFDPAAVMADVGHLFAPVASEKGVALESLPMPPDCGPVIGDARRLRQVLTNLVGNAVKFTETGKITLALDGTAPAGDALILRFSVQDSGMGISAKDLEKLFKPFIQADITTSRKYGGTGLGLAISKRLVEGMGGTLTAKSAPGHGSTFSFTIRVMPDHAVGAVAAPPKAIERDTGSLNPPLAAVRRKILLAEDNDTSRFLISAMLTRLGHQVDTVENGDEAVKAAVREPYDVILMDKQMPIMDGLEATREIRRLMSGQNKVPIIALTADVIVHNRSTYIAAGVGAIVGKPVDWAELSAEIERQIAAGKNASEGQPTTVADVRAVSDDLHPANTLPVQPANGGGSTMGDLDKAPVFDEAALTMLAGALGEPALLSMLVTFGRNMRKYQSDLTMAVTAGDLRRAKNTAHALKGVCAQFGAPRASGLAAFIEREATSLDDLHAILPRLNDIIAATEQALAARRARAAE